MDTGDDILQKINLAIDNANLELFKELVNKISDDGEYGGGDDLNLVMQRTLEKIAIRPVSEFVFWLCNEKHVALSTDITSIAAYFWFSQERREGVISQLLRENPSDEKLLATMYKFSIRFDAPEIMDIIEQHGFNWEYGWDYVHNGTWEDLRTPWQEQSMSALQSYIVLDLAKSNKPSTWHRLIKHDTPQQILENCLELVIAHKSTAIIESIAETNKTLALRVKDIAAATGYHDMASFCEAKMLGNRHPTAGRTKTEGL